MRGDELLNLLKRHKMTLKSLRLRHILLRRGQTNDCSWRDVLQFIRRGIRPEPLDGYVSLRGIDYVEDDIHAANGMHFLNGPAQNVVISDEDSDSDSDVDELSDTWSDSTEDVIEEDDASDASASNTVVGEQNEDEQDELDETDESHESLESHDEVDDLARDFRNIPVVETVQLPCNCANGTRWNDLDDDGRAVTKYQWKRWQKWVVKHCSLHDPPISDDT
jgi:hypothetical protein